MKGKYEIFSDQNNQFYFRLKASNGKIILRSEGYMTKDNCQNGIDFVRANGINEANYEKMTDKYRQCYFVLKTNNGQTIGSSEQYTTPQSMSYGIDSVKRNAASITIVDLTVRR